MKIKGEFECKEVIKRKSGTTITFHRYSSIEVSTNEIKDGDLIISLSNDSDAVNYYKPGNLYLIQL